LTLQSLARVFFIFPDIYSSLGWKPLAVLGRTLGSSHRKPLLLRGAREEIIESQRERAARLLSEGTEEQSADQMEQGLQERALAMLRHLF
jgi:hypothetical protein